MKVILQFRDLLGILINLLVIGHAWTQVPTSNQPWAPPAELPAASTRSIAITIDDLPFVGYGAPLSEMEKGTDKILAALSKYDVTAVGFVSGESVMIPGEIDRRLALLNRWLSAGHELGNHTYSHLDFSLVSMDDFTADIIKAEVPLQLLQKPLEQTGRYFRFPMNHTGKTAVERDAMDSFLKQRGYVAVPFTVENEDYLFAQLYQNAEQKGDLDLVQRIRDAYLEFATSKMAYMEKVSQRLFKREIPQILLLHANALNGDALDILLDQLHSRGYQFISLAAAMADSAYLQPQDYIGRFGPSWLFRWALNRGQEEIWRGDPDPPVWIQELAKK